MSLILSHLHYCNLVWGGACKTTLDPLFKLQKRAVRIVDKSAFLAHTDPIFKSLKILSLNKVFVFNCLMFIYKCINLCKYPEFNQRLNRFCDAHFHDTRGSNLLKPPKDRLEICRNSFLTKGINYWNSLHITLKLSKNLHIFKKRIKNALILNELDISN